MADSVSASPAFAHQGPSEAYMQANKGPGVIAVITTIVAISTVFVFARLFVRTRILGKVEVDDCLILLGLACAWICVGMTIASVYHGFGRHFDVLPLDGKQQMIKWAFFSFTPSILAFTIPKFAVVTLLTRLLNPARWHRVFLWVLVSTCQVAILGCAIILFAQCTPSRAQWDFSITNVKCWSPWLLVRYSMVAGCFSALTDLYLAVYPTIVLFKLQINNKKKIALCSALSIGSVSAIVSLYKSTRLPSLAGADFSWDTTDLVIWSLIEGSTIIIASCIPLLQPLLDVLMGRRTLCSTPRSGSYNNSSGGGHEVYYGGRRHTHLSTTRDSYHKQLWSKSRSPKSTVDDVELQAGGGATMSMSKNIKSPKNAAELQDDDDLLVVTTPATAAESETYFAVEVGVGGDMGDGLRYSHDAKAESQESILILMGHCGQDMEDQNGHEHDMDGEGNGQLQPQKRTRNHGMVDDRTRSSVATTMSGVVISQGQGLETGPAGGGGRGAISRTPTPMGMILRTQEVTMTVEQTTQGGGGGGGFDAGHGTGGGGDMPAYPAGTASLRW
ncbi:hypothetical protein NEUTE1DRAFT_112432 [Neurospora tetrasperma FGSC 2508]|uniref:Rhodopsin domain-containing protein n=1 Tax=Neurospora tetrasperma (strain FGSC 2508 / ATCC MYA-4615 / P0657) TaxID=510951 RepID=F8MST5_NEUT8|nr:uncharacterized protein NEUTE1DRAFT_112432 [Neurospora tetrasperma FGSC 2508]EGO55971.1 hypothetical protein NEUTE1DRAFT_112432 [Neurospora tetrasperma FGSC 2508]EGZ68768.1 hypothetical protein NEUTE2DRAFT_70123 [Neurospora tetrasperma FGSC 2509]